MPLQGLGWPHEKDHDLTAVCFTDPCMKVTLNLYLQESPACKTAHSAVPSEHVLSQECPKYFLSSQSPPVPLLSLPLLFPAGFLALLLTRTWGVRRHQTQPACPSCSAREKQRFGKWIYFPWHPFSAQRDSHRGTGQWA